MKADDDFKCYSIRLPKNIWLFLKTTAAHNDMNMSEVVIRCIQKYKTKLEKKLTSEDLDI